MSASDAASDVAGALVSNGRESPKIIVQVPTSPPIVPRKPPFQRQRRSVQLANSPAAIQRQPIHSRGDTLPCRCLSYEVSHGHHHHRLHSTTSSDRIRPKIDTSPPLSMYNSPKSIHYRPFPVQLYRRPNSTDFSFVKSKEARLGSASNTFLKRYPSQGSLLVTIFMQLVHPLSPMLACLQRMHQMMEEMFMDLGIKRPNSVKYTGEGKGQEKNKSLTRNRANPTASLSSTKSTSSSNASFLPKSGSEMEVLVYPDYSKGSSSSSEHGSNQSSKNSHSRSGSSSSETSTQGSSNQGNNSNISNKQEENNNAEAKASSQLSESKRSPSDGVTDGLNACRAINSAGLQLVTVGRDENASTSVVEVKLQYVVLSLLIVQIVFPFPVLHGMPIKAPIYRAEPLFLLRNGANSANLHAFVVSNRAEGASCTVPVLANLSTSCL
uniref:Uncharacterized protein n=1 Tax=Ditylenchus dipsaci TaxID=166011 RepID=A0A915DL26_9BILA